MDLRNTQIKDTYGNILTTGTVAGAPTIGTIQNGQGTNVTTLTLDGDLTVDNVTATVLTGTLSTAAQTSITSVGTLTGLSVNGTTALQGAVTVNESGANVDFRVEGDTDANLFFVDASTDRVGIGTNAPLYKLMVGTSATSFLGVIPDGTNGTALRIGGGGAGAGFLRFLSAGDAERMRLDAASVRLWIGNGTTSATPVAAAQIETTGGDGTDIAGSELRIKGGASTGSAAGGAITFYTSAAGASGTTVRSQAERLRITSAGNLKIGGSADRATTEGTAQLVLFNGTAPVGTLANGVSFYSASGEANVMDAAGNATLLSPHDKDTNEWIFRSKHTPTGKVLKIDVERMLRFINDHFGLDMIEEFTEA